MGFTNLVFTTGQKLSHTIMEQMDANFDAMAEGDESAPRIPRPRLWAHFCGKTDAEKGLYVSEGISSFTRNNVGDYSLSFTTPISSTNVGFAISTDSGFATTNTFVRNANIYTLTNSNMKIKYAASSNTDQTKEDQIAVHVVVWDFGAGNY